MIIAILQVMNQGTERLSNFPKLTELAAESGLTLKFLETHYTTLNYGPKRIRN